MTTGCALLADFVCREEFHKSLPFAGKSRNCKLLGEEGLIGRGFEMDLEIDHLTRKDTEQARGLIEECGVVKIDEQRFEDILRLPGIPRVVRAANEVLGVLHRRSIAGGNYIDLWGVCDSPQASQILRMLLEDALDALKEHRSWIYVDVLADDDLRAVFQQLGFTVEDDHPSSTEPRFSGIAELSGEDLRQILEQTIREQLGSTFDEHLSRLRDPNTQDGSELGALYWKMAQALRERVDSLIANRIAVYNLRYDPNRVVLCHCYASERHVE
jgi:hypothetical protein